MEFQFYLSAISTLTRRRCYRRVSVPPSERFVWAMVVLIVALVGLVAIEIVLILVTTTKGLQPTVQAEKSRQTP